MQGAGAALKTSNEESATIRGGCARLNTRLSAMQYQLSTILDRLVSRPKSIENHRQEPGITDSGSAPVNDSLTSAHLTANEIEQSITAISNLVG